MEFPRIIIAALRNSKIMSLAEAQVFIISDKIIVLQLLLMRANQLLKSFYTIVTAAIIINKKTDIGQRHGLLNETFHQSV